MTRKIILGGPGAGKTTRLLDIMQEELERGVDPASLAFVSYTKKAAEEAAERAMERFGLDRDALPHFRTIHSLCYRQLGVSRGDVLSVSDYRMLGEMLGTKFNTFRIVEGPPSGDKGEEFLHVMNYASATMTTLQEAWHVTGRGLDWWRLKQVDATIKQYKRDMNRITFSDMLERYLAQGAPLDVEVAIIDEAQDLSKLQWQVVHKAFSEAERVYVAGDDDQAIHQWAGADVPYFLNMKGEVEILPVSYRLPQEIFDLVGGIANGIKHRRPKEWTSSGRAGVVDWCSSQEELDLSCGEWMLLARNGYQLRDFYTECRHQGVAYRTAHKWSIDPEHIRGIVTWERLRKGEAVASGDFNAAAALIKTLPEVPDDDLDYDLAGVNFQDLRVWHDIVTGLDIEDVEYYLAILRAGERLQDKPRIHVGTIHSVKGGEADHVALCTDLSYRNHRGFEIEPDSEHRVFYVGASRAKKSLHVLAPRTHKYYPM